MSTNIDDQQPDGDAPDTFDDRLFAITRLIDTADDELDEARRRRRLALVLRLLTALALDANRRIIIQLDRLEP